MPELTAEALELLRQTHAKGCQLFQGTAYKPESVETAIEVESHRWYWKPIQPKLLLVAESHVFTSEGDMGRRVDESQIRPFLRLRRSVSLPPDRFVRLVYCLAYGETKLLIPQLPQISNHGTPPYWDIFGRVSFRCPQPRQEDGARFGDRIRWKVETLRELYRMGIWLLDASVHAVYLGGKRRLPDAMKQEFHKQWWESYGRFLMRTCESAKVWVIGKTVYDCLTDAEFNDWTCRGWVYQPNASGFDLNQNWPQLLDDCWNLHKLSNA